VIGRHRQSATACASPMPRHDVHNLAGVQSTDTDVQACAMCLHVCSVACKLLSRVYTSATCCPATCCADEQHVAGQQATCCRQHVSLCIQQQTGNKLATILLPVTCCLKQHVAGNVLPLLPGVNAALVVSSFAWVQTTGRRLTNTADDNNIVNFSPLCPTIQSGPLRFRSFNDFFHAIIFHQSSPNQIK